MSNPLFVTSPAEEQGRFFGVTVGVVTNLNDPEGLGRVKLKLPWLDDGAETSWARVVSPMAGAGMGLLLPPEPGDEVLVAFEHGMLEYPYVLGSLWGGQDKPPAGVEQGKVKLRSLTTRSGHRLEFAEDEEGAKGGIALTTKGGRSIQIGDGEESLTIGSAKHSLTLDDRTGALEIESGGTLTLKAGQCKLAFSDSGVEIAFQGATLKLSAQGAELASNSMLTVKAAGKLGVEANGVVQIRGGTVMIN
ncbi:MAG TPA: phage baseplate assembly protein V [Chloroflexaceae bacterium]|nr:phage baseplate assembly protein V [Chloroflexaceae bacterium]